MDASHFIATWDLFWEWMGGPLIVALFFWFRFHSLEETRSYTTFALYWFGVVCFVLPFIGLYFVLNEKGNLSPLAAAWMLILFWLVPWLAGAWREFWHGVAKIPHYAHRLRDVLMTVPFELQPADAAAVTRTLARLGYQTDDISALQPTIIQARLVKFTAIMHHLEKWETDHRHFMARNAEQYSALLQGFDLLSFKAIRVLKTVAALHSSIMQENTLADDRHDDWKTLDSLAASEVRTSRLQSAAQAAAGVLLEDFLDGVLLFVARAVLAGEWTFTGRRRRLEEIGFTIPGAPPSIVPALVSALAITVIWTTTWFLVMGDRITTGGNVAAIRGVTLPTLNLALNFLLVYYLKRTFGFANEGVFGDKPIGFILCVGLITAVLVLPIRIVLDVYEYMAPPARPLWWVVLHGAPLSLFPWMTGAVTAYLAQDLVWQTIETRWIKRLLDGIAFGVTTAMATGLIYLVHTVLTIPQMERVTPLHPAGVLLSAFVFGLVVGVLVIMRIREGSALGQPPFRQGGTPVAFAR